MKMNFTLFAILLCILTAILIIPIAVLSVTLKRKKLRRYEKIYIDMPEETMLEIMGKGYNKSSLRDNTQKYEWRMNGMSSGYSAGGGSTRSYTGVRKVDIYVKNGKVIEIKPYNV